MKNAKRLFYYLLINILVSACTTLAVLFYWERTHTSSSAVENPLEAFLATPTVYQPAMNAMTATALVQPTLTPRPLITYRVLPGDTLGGLALEFGIDVDELMALNGITDPSVLGAGQVLFVPLVATETAEVVLVSESTQPVTLPGTSPVQTGSVSIESKVKITNVFGVGDLPTERVRLERVGDGEVPLAGWKLFDEDENAYSFPALTLFPGGAVDLYSGPGANSVTALYWGLSEPAWETGETVTLVDSLGIVQATYQVP